MKYRAYIVILLSVIVACFYVANAQSHSLKKIKEKKIQNETVIRESTIKLNENDVRLSKQLDRLNSLNVQIEEKNVLIEQEQSTLDSINAVIENVNDTMSIFQQQLDVMKKQYAEAARQMYIRRGDMNDLAFIFSSASFKQAYRRMRYLRQFSQWRDNKTKEISELQSVLEKRKKQLSSLKTDKAKSIANVNSALQGLNEDKKNIDELVLALNKEKKALQSLIKKKEKETKQLDEDLERIIEEEQRRQEEEHKRKEAEERRIKEERRRKEIVDSIKQVEEKERQEAEKRRKDSIAKATEKVVEKPQPPKEVEKEIKKEHEIEKRIEPKKEKEQPQPIEKKPVEKKKTSAQLTAEFKASKGKLPYPATGKCRVVRGFGQQKHPNMKYITTDSKGIYIETTDGANAVAVYEGEVSRVLSHRTYNTIIIVRHGEYFAIYCNVADVSVKEGDVVKQGQKIGKIFVPADENSGILHFQVRCGREELDPMKWIKR